MIKKCKFFKRLSLVVLLLITLISCTPTTSVKADELKSASEVGLPDATSSNFTAKGYVQGAYKKPLKKYPDKTVSGMGCGFCTVCGIHTTISGEKKDPYDVANKYINYYTHGEGCKHAVINGILSKWGYTVKGIGCSKSELQKYLQKGYIVAMISKGPIFTSEGHFLYVYGYEKRTSYTTQNITSGKDKSGREEKACARVFTSSKTHQNKQWFPLDSIVADANSGASDGGPFWAVVKYDGEAVETTGDSESSESADEQVATSGDGYIQFGGEVMDEEYFLPTQDNQWGYNLVTMATSENLTVNEQTQIARWSENIKNNSRGVVGFFRTLSAFLGIMITIYSLLLYMCYWLDRSNNIVDVSTLRILTFNQIQISPDDNSTFNPNQQGTKYIIHKDIIFIVIIGCTIGVLIMTGKIYSIVGAFWHWTNSLIK